LEEFPYLQNLKDRFGSQGLEIVAFEAFHPPQQVLSHARESSFTFTIAALSSPEWFSSFMGEGDYSITEHFGVKAIPVNVILDEYGQVIYRGVGFCLPDILATLLRVGFR
jgi:hypothetical protein